MNIAKHLVAIICVIAVTFLSGCFVNEDKTLSEAEKKETTDTLIALEYEISTIGSYDIDLYLDDEKLGTFEQSNEDVFIKIVGIESGNHTIKAQQYGDDTNFAKQSLTIYQNQYSEISTVKCEITKDGLQMDEIFTVW